MAGMRGEMSQMVAERPNAGAIRHYDRCGVISRPRGRGFVPVAAHVITPIGVAAGPQKCPHGVSPRAPDVRLFMAGFAVACLPVSPATGGSILGAVPRSPCAPSSAKYESFCQLQAISSFIGHETVRSVSCPKVPRLARCCASRAFAWNRCASLRSSSSARQ
jgi:hypothetical protein